MTSLSLLALASLLPLLPLSSALNNEQMRARTVYQVVTDRFALTDGSTSKSCNSADRAYCGGTWAGLTAKLDYIKGMGFDTVWISPVVDNIPGTTGYGQAYHGYWTRNPDALNSNFGSATDLQALATALHSKQMYLMLDVVVNHVASTAGASFATNSSYGPFSTQSDFHPQCWIQDSDYTQNQTAVEFCWLGDSTVALPDLNTESQSVITYWNNWVKNIVSNYSVDAIRIDTVKHIPQTFWPGFTSAAGVANVGEVLDPRASFIGSYQRNASINPFNYAVYYPLARAFNNTQGDLLALSSMITQVKTNSSDTSLYGSFINNHDNARFESWVTDKALIRNAQSWPFVGDGVPYTYYGSEAGFNGANDPYNREAFWPTNYNTSTEMYALFKRLNGVRRAAATASSTFYNNTMNVYVPTQNEMVILKQPLISVLSNSGASAANHTVPIESGASGWGPNTVLLDAVQCGTYTTDGSGNIAATISGGNPLILIEKSKAGNICDGYVPLSSASSSGSTNNTGGGSGTKSGAGRVEIATGLGLAGLAALVGLLL